MPELIPQLRNNFRFDSYDEYNCRFDCKIWELLLLCFMHYQFWQLLMFAVPFLNNFKLLQFCWSSDRLVDSRDSPTSLRIALYSRLHSWNRSLSCLHADTLGNEKASMLQGLTLYTAQKSLHICSVSQINNHNRSGTFQMMFCLAAIDVTTLVGNSFVGMIFITGGMFCHAPKLNYFISCLFCGMRFRSRLNR